MSQIIDNSQGNSLADSLEKILPSCSGIDVLVGYFFFSGYQEIYEELRDKKIRILIGLEVDAKVEKIVSKMSEESIERLKGKEEKILFPQKAKESYFEIFSSIFNKTDIFDNDRTILAFESFLEKIKDGTLEIKKTKTPEHGKFYLLHFNEQSSLGGITPGYTISGSSNFTFNGLKGQGEHNRILKETHYYESDKEKFESLWNDASNITIADVSSYDSFTQEIKKRLWLYALPNPYLLYLKVIYEYFTINETDEEIITPSQITGGKFSDFKYQIDAIKFGVDRLNKFGGVIVADVVGLGKSIIASAIAKNMNLKTIVIAPPHLMEQWEDYKFEFGFNALVYSSGSIDKALEKHQYDTEDLLIILDEAHKHRNEETQNYSLLHRLCVGNKILALSATPFNNDPKDIYAIIKLFDTPGQSVIRTVENLSFEFRELIETYKKLRKELRGTKNKNPDEEKIKQKANDIANKLRYMISPIVIRRSRLDIERIDDYRKDLERQGVYFAKVCPPQLFEYELNEVSDIYLDTLERVSPFEKFQEDESFEGARYQIVSYIHEGSTWLKKLQEEFDVANLGDTQKQIAKIMRRLLVRRFESSVASFESTLKNMIQGSKETLKWYHERKELPIYKKGGILSLDELEEFDVDELEEYFKELNEKGAFFIPASEIGPNFILTLQKDIEILEDIYDDWFTPERKSKFRDYKFEFFKKKVLESFEKEPKRKIIVFTEFSDTANYLFEECKKYGMRVFKYSSQDASKDNKETIRKNFDAGYQHQENKYDILIATDAISEGYNLHRAGTIINYDIPYNPTRVIQRVGRINRINKKVFDELYIYNFFPTSTGEKEVKTKAISTLKMNLIHALLGGDTQIFTSDEELRSYFADSYKKHEAQNEALSWDSEYRNIYDSIKHNKKILEEIEKIPFRTRIAREKGKGVCAFGKKGESYVFAYGENDTNIVHLSPEQGFKLFEAHEGEEALETSEHFYNLYKKVKEHLFKNNTNPTLKGRRQKAAQNLDIIGELHPEAKDYCDLISQIIYELDALPDGVLKEISLLKIKKDSLEKLFEKIQTLVPSNYIEELISVGEKNKGDEEYILLSEQFLG